MPKGEVYYNAVLAGWLEKKGSDKYEFIYEEVYYNDPASPPVSLTLPKKKISYQSTTLFPFFLGLLSEGINKEIQCRLLRIDEDDDFTRLLRTAGGDTIGAITVKEINE